MEIEEEDNKTNQYCDGVFTLTRLVRERKKRERVCVCCMYVFIVKVCVIRLIVLLLHYDVFVCFLFLAVTFV